MANKKKLFRREYIPLAIAISVLVLLIVALVFTIINKPKKEEGNKPTLMNEQILSTDEKVVSNETCVNDEYNELIEKVKNITVSYEEVEYTFGSGHSLNDEFYEGMDDEEEEDADVIPSIGYALKVALDNVPKNVSIVVTNDQDYDAFEYANTDETGDYYEWIQPETTFLRVYNFKVYNKLDGCHENIIREFEVTLPRFNEGAKLDICLDAEYKDKDMCKHFIFEPFDLNKDFDRVEKAVVEVKNEKAKQEEAKKQEEQKNDKRLYIIIASFVAVVVIVIIIVIIVLKGRKKHEKK